MAIPLHGSKKGRSCGLFCCHDPAEAGFDLLDKSLRNVLRAHTYSLDVSVLGDTNAFAVLPFTAL